MHHDDRIDAVADQRGQVLLERAAGRRTKLPVRTAFRPVEVAPDDALPCPVTVAYRTEDGPLPAPPRTLAEVIAIRGLVIEVRLLAVGQEVPSAA